jgi:hypothetical protein
MVKGEERMNELLKVVMDTYKAFYLGRDTEGWKAFSTLITLIQDKIENDQTDPAAVAMLTEFITHFDTITDLRKEGNYTLIADLFYDLHLQLTSSKGLN